MNAPHTRRSVPEGTRRSAHWWHLRGKNFVPADALSRFPTSGHWFVSPFLRARVIDGVCPLLQTHTHKGNIERIGLSNVCPFRCVRQRVLVSGQHFTLSNPWRGRIYPKGSSSSRALTGGPPDVLRFMNVTVPVGAICHTHNLSPLCILLHFPRRRRFIIERPELQEGAVNLVFWVQNDLRLNFIASWKRARALVVAIITVTMLKGAHTRDRFPSRALLCHPSSTVERLGTCVSFLHTSRFPGIVKCAVEWKIVSNRTRAINGV